MRIRNWAKRDGPLKAFQLLDQLAFLVFRALSTFVGPYEREVILYFNFDLSQYTFAFANNNPSGVFLTP